MRGQEWCYKESRWYLVILLLLFLEQRTFSLLFSARRSNGGKSFESRPMELIEPLWEKTPWHGTLVVLMYLHAQFYMWTRRKNPIAWSYSLKANFNAESRDALSSMWAVALHSSDTAERQGLDRTGGVGTLSTTPGHESLCRQYFGIGSLQDIVLVSVHQKVFAVSICLSDHKLILYTDRPIMIYLQGRIWSSNVQTNRHLYRQNNLQGTPCSQRDLNMPKDGVGGLWPIFRLIMFTVYRIRTCTTPLSRWRWWPW